MEFEYEVNPFGLFLSKLSGWNHAAVGKHTCQPRVKKVMLSSLHLVHCHLFVCVCVCVCQSFPLWNSDKESRWQQKQCDQKWQQNVSRQIFFLIYSAKVLHPSIIPKFHQMRVRSVWHFSTLVSVCASTGCDCVAFFTPSQLRRSRALYSRYARLLFLL